MSNANANSPYGAAWAPSNGVRGSLVLFNESGAPRWDVNVVLLADGSFGVQESGMERSIFSYRHADGLSLSKPGATVAEAITNFIAVEAALIESLGAPTAIDRQGLIRELRSYDNGSVCLSDIEWEVVRRRRAEICGLLGIEHPEDAESL